MTVIQAYTSVAGFEKHGEWMAPKIPRLVPLLASPPDPPVLLRSVSRNGPLRVDIGEQRSGQAAPNDLALRRPGSD